jgi:hypothetical protein
VVADDLGEPAEHGVEQGLHLRPSR